jgi:hypothetical protein
VLAPLAVALAIVPGAIYLADAERTAIDEGRPGFFVGPDDLAALRHLERAPDSSGVLTSPSLAPAVPAYTGRRTWVGHPVWTPRYPQRARETSELFAGRLNPARTQALLRRAGVRWVLAPCGTAAALRLALRPSLRRQLRFGCATLYEVTVEPRDGLVNVPAMPPPRSRRNATATAPTATATQRPIISAE